MTSHTELLGRWKETFLSLCSADLRQIYLLGAHHICLPLSHFLPWFITAEFLCLP